MPGSAVLFTLAMCLSSAKANPPPEVVAGHGNVEASGKFVPEAAAPKVAKVPLTPEKWQEQLAELAENLGDGSFRIGLVRVDAEKRTVSFPARVNAREGLIEYALVTEQGKVHESLLATKASPLHVHLASLLTGLAAADDPATPRDVEILIEWETNGPRRSHRLEELISLAKENPWGPVGSTLEKGKWSYQGSSVDARGFVATREGSLIALIGDQSALVLNPRPGHVDDGLHVPNSTLIPAKDFPVLVILKAAPTKESNENQPTPKNP